MPKFRVQMAAMGRHAQEMLGNPCLNRKVRMLGMVLQARHLRNSTAQLKTGLPWRSRVMTFLSSQIHVWRQRCVPLRELAVAR